MLYKETCSCSIIAQVGQAVERVIEHNEECQNSPQFMGIAHTGWKSYAKLSFAKC